MAVGDRPAARLVSMERPRSGPRRRVPAAASVLAERASDPIRSASGRRLSRKHVLMLLLALEVFAFGLCNADRYRPPGVAVELPAQTGHIIT